MTRVWKVRGRTPRRRLQTPSNSLTSFATKEGRYCHDADTSVDRTLKVSGAVAPRSIRDEKGKFLSNGPIQRTEPFDDIPRP